jgi:pSer/pThr/pTyr-binding forkhead associated (FHA) protein/outer membrane biosynthesis protein TonB
MEAKATSTIPIRLDVLGPDGNPAHTTEFVKEKIVLGRILSADVRIDDPRVSRIHALIEVRNDSILLTDLASTHGTFVNGQKVVEHKVKFGDVIKLGFQEIRVEKGSGKASVPSPLPQQGRPIFDGEETKVDIDRSMLESMDRRDRVDRRKKDAFPEESRLEERRQGDRRAPQKVGPEGTPMPSAGINTGVAGAPDVERRVGERRRGERRVFDITSLERRIEDRRGRRSDDDILPEELEKAFESPDHARELEVTALWGDHILDVSNYFDPVVLTAGESPRNQYIIPSVGIPDEFPLVTIEEDGTAYLAFTGDMTGTVRARDKIYSIKDLKEEKFIKKYADYYVLGLKQDDFAKLSIGTVNFFILYVRPAPRIKSPPIFERDVLLMRTAIGSLLFLVLLFTAVTLFPPPKPVTIEMIPERFAKIVIKSRPVIPPAPKEKATSGVEGKEAQQGGSVSGEGGPAKGPEGEAGRKDLPRKAEKPQVVMKQSRPKEKPQEQPKQADTKPTTQPQRKLVDSNKAKSVGLLKAFNSSGIQKEVKNLLDSNEGPEGDGGFDKFGKNISGIRGHSLEETGGAAGKGVKGVDAGGTGKTVGIDGPSTKGLGRGYHGDGIGEGISGPGRLGMKGEHAISIVSENVQVLSGLPKDVINAVVQRHRSEIRACYDAALQKNPALRGKVVVAFNIQPNGVVSYAAVKESTLGDSGLDNCIVSRVKSWNFPKPEAPVVTEVTAFPFYLSPAN